VDVHLRPRLRGVFHQYAFFAALAAGVGIVIAADTARARLAMAVYGVALATMFGVSAVYHRVVWRTPETRQRMRRLDHSAIPFLIAGTYTPFALLAFHGGLATAVLVVVWAGAAVSLLLNLFWVDAPKWVTAVVFIALGWVGIATVPQLVDLGAAPALLVLLGGVFYTAGAAMYAARRPNPVPLVFGYHEIFHLLVIAAAAAHFVAIARYVLPRA